MVTSAAPSGPLQSGKEIRVTRSYPHHIHWAGMGSQLGSESALWLTRYRGLSLCVRLCVGDGGVFGADGDDGAGLGGGLRDGRAAYSRASH